MNINTTSDMVYSINDNTDTNFEIIKTDPETGTQTAFVFQDLSIGNKNSERKEVIFYSYEIQPNGSRVYVGRHSYTDFSNEFKTFLKSEIWEALKSQIISDFLKKIEFVEIL